MSLPKSPIHKTKNRKTEKNKIKEERVLINCQLITKTFLVPQLTNSPLWSRVDLNWNKDCLGSSQDWHLIWFSQQVLTDELGAHSETAVYSS